MLFGYVRESNSEPEIKSQKERILNYVQTNGLKIERFFEVPINKDTKNNSIDKLIYQLSDGDMLIIAGLSYLGNSLKDILETINRLFLKDIELRIIQEDFIVSGKSLDDPYNKALLDVLSMLSNVEKELVFQRIREAQNARKKEHVKLGKPKGTIQPSIYDKDKTKIIELVNIGLSLNKIVSKHLKYGTVQSLSTYLKRRKLDPQASDTESK